MTALLRGLRAAGTTLATGMVLAIPGCASDAPPPVPTAENPCPPWVEFPTNRHSNAEPAYLGCSNAVNLRAMVADPADLERGRPLGPANGIRATLGVENYELGKVKALIGSGTFAPGGGSGGGGGGGGSQ